MMKIELKVSIWCQKCKTELLKAVTKIPGVDHVSVNVEKEMLIVIGDVDPVLVATNVRKKDKYAEIVSVGPPTKPAEAPTKPDKQLPPSCGQCQLVGYTFVEEYNSGPCSIL